MLKVTDADGQLLDINDDREDPGTGINTHHADSYVQFQVPAAGKYYIHLGDTTRRGSRAHAYRLRIGPPRPDFALRVVPSCANLRSKGSVALTIHAIRKDGLQGNIAIRLKDPPPGFQTRGVTLKAGQDSVRLSVRTTRRSTEQPLNLVIEGRANIKGEQVVRAAVPAEDRMQAFLWRHLVPAQQLATVVFDPTYKPPLTRVPKPTEKAVAKQAVAAKAEQPKFTKRQVAGRLRQLNGLYQEWLLTDAFYSLKVAECETALE
jgi:hypothetical protein